MLKQSVKVARSQNLLENKEVSKKVKVPKQKSKKEMPEERAGDWTCRKCKNLNFGFRDRCNRCNLKKESNGDKSFAEKNTKVQSNSIFYSHENMELIIPQQFQTNQRDKLISQSKNAGGIFESWGVSI